MTFSLPRRSAAAGLLALALGLGMAQLVWAETRVDKMPPEMGHAYMLAIQEELLAHGYHVGPVDGKIGKKSKGAIRQYQRDAGLAVNGVATKELLDHLKFSIPKVYARGTVIEPNALVRDIQTELHDRGYYPGVLDGRYGPLTRAAIGTFQVDAGLPVDGQADSAFLNAIRNADPSLRRN